MFVAPITKRCNITCPTNCSSDSNCWNSVRQHILVSLHGSICDLAHCVIAIENCVFQDGQLLIYCRLILVRLIGKYSSAAIATIFDVVRNVCHCSVCPISYVESLIDAVVVYVRE